MSAVSRFLAASFACGLLSVTAVAAAERVGEAVVVKTAVTGGAGPIIVKSPIHRNERIKTSNDGLGQFVFRDGTKLAVGWGSSVVIDKFVFDDANTAKKLTIKATKGTFRWISGGSKSTAYEIITPAGTLGVRGTAFDFFVGANGVTAVVLYSGSARFCGSNGCQTLNKRCDTIVATRGRGVSQPERMRANVINALGSSRALPFLTGNQRLTRSFSVAGGCLQSASTQPLKAEPLGRPRTVPKPPDDPPPGPFRSANPIKPDRPKRPDGVGRPERPDQTAEVDKPSKPSRPSQPGQPSHPEHPGEDCSDPDHGGEGGGEGEGKGGKGTHAGRQGNTNRHTR